MEEEQVVLGFEVGWKVVRRLEEGVVSVTM